MAIERRTFLKGVGSLATTASASRFALGREHKYSIAVVGAGIVGASIAMHLSRAGAQVTLFEKTAPAAGATGKSFAWINAFTTDPHYRALRLKSIYAYRALDRQLQLSIVWGGAIHWAVSLAEAESMRASSAELNQSGYPAGMITPEELANLAPNLRLGPFEAAFFSPLDGHMDPVFVTRRFLQQAKTDGLRVVHPCEVTELLFKGNRFSGVSTSVGDYSFDRIVIASGVDTPTLAMQTGFTPPLTHAPGILVHTKPTTALVGRVVESPHLYFKQDEDGRIVGTDGYHAPEIPAHQEIFQGPQEMPEEIREMHGKRILGHIKDKLSGADDAAYDYLTLGYRPMPQDRLPIVGFAPGNPDVYIAVMHSGVTLAAIMGRYISHEIMNNDLIDDLAPYRPNRFKELLL